MEHVMAYMNAIKSQAWSLVVAYLVFAVGSLLLSKKSQIDVWVEAKPRRAGVMKIFRGLGLDPWLVVQGIVLLFKGRLPKGLGSVPPPPPPSDPTPPTGTVRPVSKPPSGAAATMLLFIFATSVLASLATGSPTLGFTGCASAKDPSALIKSSEALAYNGAVVAFEILDQREADSLDAILKPTAEQLAKAQDRIDRLKRIREALNIARAWIEGSRSLEDGRAALTDAVKALRLVANELKADGVKIPRAVDDGLSTAEKLLGG